MVGGTGVDWGGRHLEMRGLGLGELMNIGGHGEDLGWMLRV